MPEDDQTIAFSQSLMLSGRFWVFRIMDPNWSSILAHYLWKYFVDSEPLDPDALQASYVIRYKGVEHYLISKEYVPSHVLAKMLNKSVPEIHQADVIELRKIPRIGDPKAVANVNYCGTA